MGTRAQVFMKDEGIYLYQHWDGNMLMDTVVKAVQSPAGKGRQDDALGAEVGDGFVQDSLVQRHDIVRTKDSRIREDW